MFSERSKCPFKKKKKSFIKVFLGYANVKWTFLFIILQRLGMLLLIKKINKIDEKTLHEKDMIFRHY